MHWEWIWVLSSALYYTCPLTSTMRQDAPSKQLLLFQRFSGFCGVSFLPSGATGCLGRWAWICRVREDAGPHALPWSLEPAWRSAASASFLLHRIRVLVSISFWSPRTFQRLLVWAVRIIKGTHQNKKWTGAIICPWWLDILVTWKSSCSLLVPKTKLIL